MSLIYFLLLSVQYFLCNEIWCSNKHKYDQITRNNCFKHILNFMKVVSHLVNYKIHCKIDIYMYIFNIRYWTIMAGFYLFYTETKMSRFRINETSILTPPKRLFYSYRLNEERPYRTYLKICYPLCKFGKNRFVYQLHIYGNNPFLNQDAMYSKIVIDVI